MRSPPPRSVPLARTTHAAPASTRGHDPRCETAASGRAGAHGVRRGAVEMEDPRKPWCVDPTVTYGEAVGELGRRPEVHQNIGNERRVAHSSGQTVLNAPATPSHGARLRAARKPRAIRLRRGAHRRYQVRARVRRSSAARVCTLRPPPAEGAGRTCHDRRKRDRGARR